VLLILYNFVLNQRHLLFIGESSKAAIQELQRRAKIEREKSNKLSVIAQTELRSARWHPNPHVFDAAARPKFRLGCNINLNSHRITGAGCYLRHLTSMQQIGARMGEGGLAGNKDLANSHFHSFPVFCFPSSDPINLDEGGE
jgi:hypothetical protein